jgi:hypothetical protein
MDYVDIKNIRHYIYDSLDEMKEHYRYLGKKLPEIKDNWRIADRYDWVISDDNRICQILRKGHMKKVYDESYYVGTAVGTFNCTYSKEMDTDLNKHKNRYMFSINYENSHDAKLNRKGLSRAEAKWIALSIIGNNFEDAYNQVYKPKDIRNTKDKVVFLLKQERILKALSESAKDVAKSLGLNHEWVLNNLKSIAETSISDKVKLEAVNNIGEIIGTKGDVKKETGQLLGAFHGFSGGDLTLAQRPKDADFEIISNDGETENARSSTQEIGETGQE